jgi:hypothetical protein
MVFGAQLFGALQAYWFCGHAVSLPDPLCVAQELPVSDGPLPDVCSSAS